MAYFKIIIFLTCFTALNVLAGENIKVNGIVLNKDTKLPLSGVKIGLFDLVGEWKPGTMPENVPIDFMTTGEDGKFKLEGAIGTTFVVELRDPNICLIPFAKTYFLEEQGNKRSFEVEILTGKSPGNFPNSKCNS